MPREHDPSPTELKLIDEQDRLAELPDEPLRPGEDPIVAAVGDALGALTVPLRRHLAAALDRIAALERRLADIETRGVEFMGVHQRALDYRRGSMVVFDGSLFVAVRDVAAGQDPPGSNDGWALAAKRGRDGRDAKGVIVR